MQYLNPVETTLTIAGKPTHFVHITLHQSFNAHHRIEAKIDFQELDSLWMNNPVKMIQLISEEISVEMKHKQTGESNSFVGIITDVSMNGRHGQQSYITITGCSPTIKLEGTPTMNSFADLDLNTIVKEVVSNSGNGAQVDVKPVYKSQIDYLCQYQETAFDFMNRLSWLYGEWFFYDGTTCNFGKTDKPTEELIYDTHLMEFDLNAHMIPQKMNRFEYLHHDMNEAISASPQTVSGVRGYIKVAMDQSDKVYTSDPTMPLKPSIKSKKDLDDMAKVDKYRNVSQLLIMKGKAQTCRVRIGGIVDIKLPKTMQVPLKDVEKFIVTEVLHEIDQDGTYFNTFTGIPSEMENIPMNPISNPIAQPQVAWVKTNADQKGRVKVQHQWQKKLNKETNWIRVQTPDAGKSDDVAQNRGFVFIPEEGDLVMLGYENGDPNRPYVAGSVFPENESLGCGANNYVKTIITRSGHTIKLDDSKGKEKIQVYDIKGNIVEIDTVDDTINIIANSTINMSAIDINLLAKNTITATAGNMFAASGGITSSVTGGISTFINAGKEAAIKAGKTLSASGGKNATFSSGLNSQVALDAKGNANIKGKKKVDIASKEKVNIAGDKKTTVVSSDMKIQGKKITNIKGRKVNFG